MIKTVTRTEKVKKYVQDVGYLILHQRVKPLANTRLRLELYVYPPDNKQRDLDNVCKAVLDALQHAGVYADDFYIQQLYVQRCMVRKSGAVEFKLQGI
jgi:crossover junction endodeoxyribonuclease RusA